MLLAGRTRGIDASGVAWRAPDGRIMFSKEREDAKDFVERVPNWDEIAQSRIGLLHNRAKTKGSEWKAENNHPVVGFGWVVVHNGTLTNDDELFAYHQVERPAEVDSITINMLLSRQKEYPECFRQLTVTSGGLTAAMWKVDRPDEIGIIRLGPNELYMWEWDDILYWSSAPHAGEALPYRALGSIAFQSTAMLPEDRLLVLGPGKARTFKMTRSPFSPKKVSAVVTTYPPYNNPASSATTTPVATVTSVTDGDDEQEPAASIGSEGPRNYKWMSAGGGRYKITHGENSSSTMVKPSPIFAQMRDDWYDLFAVTRGVIADPNGYAAVKTAYGTWHLRKDRIAFKDGTESTIARREFAPAKRQKPFLNFVYGTSIPVLPLIESEYSKYDQKLPLEPFWLKSKLSNGSSMETLGYMCPVCGVTLRGKEWDEQKLRCRWCRVQGFLASPMQEGGNG